MFRRKEVKFDFEDLSDEEKEWIRRELKDCDKRGIGMFWKFFWTVVGILLLPVLIGFAILWFVYYEDKRRKEDCKDMVKTRFLLMRMSKGGGKQ